MKFTVILTLGVVALIAFFVVLDNQQQEDNASDGPMELLSEEGQPTLGDPDAPVQIVEFGDYKCPSCKAWSETVYPQLKQDFIDSGEASLTYVNVLFHEEGSELAAKAGEAVYKQAPDEFWEFSKNVYEQQPSSHDEQWVTEETMLEIAKNSVESLDEEQFLQDLNSDSIAEKVDQDMELVQQYGVMQTPTVMINGTIVENPFDYEAIQQLIQEELEQQNG